MKKFSKMLALGLALAMTFGMTVSAAYSPGEIAAAEETAKKDAEAVKIPEDATIYVGDKESNLKPVIRPTSGGTYLDVTNHAVKEDTTKKIQDSVAATLSGDQELKGAPVVLGAVDVQIWNATPEELEAGVKIPLTIPGGVKAGTRYIFLHRNAMGVWETIVGSVDGDVVYVTLHSYSPIVIVAQEYKDKEKEPDKKPDQPSQPDNSGSSNTPVSPKTGEAMPVASILVVVCLAGAAVCAKRVRSIR